MKLARNVRVSIEILAAHRLRTALSVLGVVVGIAAVILMVAAGRGAQKQILDRVRSMGTNLIIVHAGQTRIVAGRERQLSRVSTLVPADAKAIVADCPSVALAAASVSRALVIRWEDETANTSVVGMDVPGFEIRNVAADAGRLYSEEEGRALQRVAVVGPTAAGNLFGGANPVGQTIRLGRVPFEVIGTTRRRGVDLNGADQDDVIFIPLGTAMRRLLNVTYLGSIYVRAISTQAMGGAELEIRDLLRARHRLGGRADDFTIQNQEALLSTERETSRSLTLLIGGVAGISLLVGGVGILGVMLISVRERRTEIGLRRALGARRPDIRLQFLLESMLLAGAGGVAGVAVGTGGALAASAFGLRETLVSWPVAAVAVLFSSVLGVFSGMYPAWRAAAVEPIDALRSD
jgi:putative ABC transport system permease protein